MKSSLREHTMKISRISTLLIVLFLSAAAMAQSQNTQSGVHRKQISLNETFTQIEVKGDVTVILTREAPGALVFEGLSKDFACVKTTVEKGKLIIDSEYRKCGSRLTVFVSITNVNTLIIGNEAEIFS